MALKKQGKQEKVGAVLVVGGGIAGIQASLDLAESGQKVYLLESSPAIGGTMARLDKTFPTNDCAMCILSPKIVECGRHLNIEIITWAELVDVKGQAGHFKIDILKRARFVDITKCTGCGECAEACPVIVENEFDASLGKRKAIFRPYPQAFPNTFVIDKHLVPPCRNACPAGVNVQGFVALMAQGQFDEALKLFRERNPFPATCGRICTHPCQDVCNRDKIEEALAIRDLHRFLADREIKAFRDGKPLEVSETKAAKHKPNFAQRGNARPVAIIGSGPAGLTCAWDLARMNYKPVVFDKLEAAGGMLRAGVPGYRLPEDILDYEIKAIEQAGVEIRLNSRIGPELTLNHLLDQGFECIFMAIGTHKSYHLGVEGEDLKGVLHGTEFLYDVKLGQPVDIKAKTVVVVGGGNTAIDSARTALRLGASRVTVLYRRTRVEMPASEEEIKACEEEGIEFLFLSSPVRISGANGKVEALECIRMILGDLDSSGRRRPIPVRDSNFMLKTDIVIPAVSQKADTGILTGFNFVQVTETGLIPLSGAGLKGVHDFTDLLKAESNGERIDLGKKVIVIGGGNAAIDVGRTAIRLGVKDVHLVCPESPEEMPAPPDKIQAAKEEGITIHNRLSPGRITGEDGRVHGVEFRECSSVFDKEGRFSPVINQGTEKVMPADSVIVAMGRAVDWELIRASDGLVQTKAGFIRVDPDTLAANIGSIFIGGDVVTGPDVAVNAIAAGHRAAISIDRFLNGEDLREGRDDIKPQPSVKDLAPVPAGSHKHASRVPMPVLPVEKRIKDFSEVELGYSREQAVMEAERCLQCSTCSECLECVSVCKAEAIFHNQKDKIEQIDVGAIVVVPGFEEFLASQKYDFGYTRYPDVVTSVQFERILSASGPFQGHVKRLSDGKTPKRIAFLQCIGSRDISCKNRYCSSVCCMYAIKEAVIAREHIGDVDVTVFFMDIRAFGKDFDKYYERAKSDYGVRFVRARVSDVFQQDKTAEITVKYTPEAGQVSEEGFDMVVLSIGLTPGEKFMNLASRLGIRLNPDGFIWTHPFRPLDTSRPGIFAGGAASGPKDIPETVTQASGAAGRASAVLADARETLTIKKEYPPERDVTGEEPRIGVFICHCGINIGGIVDVPVTAEYAGTLPNVVFAEDNLYTCSQDTQDHIREMISEHRLNRVVVASCSPRTHESMFRETVREAGLNPYLFEMANIRDQCSWIHMHEPEEATEKAKDLVRMVVAKVRSLEPLASISMKVNSGALVMGGGIAGMTASLSLANQGYQVNLVEKEKELGGHLRHIHFLLEGEDPQGFLKETIQRVTRHPKIRVWTESRVETIEGFIGNFKSKIQPKGIEIEHGVVIVATGAEEYSPSEYLYRKDKRILTQHELEERLAAVETGRSSGFKARRVVMIQCVGSREEGHMYCSRVCCSTAVKNALKIKELSPETEIFVLYRDMRTYGFSEEYYRQAREKGVLFIRYDAESKPEITNKNNNGRSNGRPNGKSNSRLKITVREPLLERILFIEPDLVVLSSRIEANPDNEELARLLKIPVNEDGFFLEAHAKLRPVDFATEGVFLAGMAHGPKSIPESIAQGKAAASRAVTIISKDTYQAEATIAAVNEDICDGCGLCVGVCEYNALEVVENKDGSKVVKLNEALCKGCGCCVAACPSGAMEQKGFKNEQILAEIEAALAL